MSARVLVLNHNFREEGTWHRAWNFARQISAGGYEVTFLCVHPRRRWRPLRTVVEGVRVIETPYLGPRRVAASGLDPWDIRWRLNFMGRFSWDFLWTFSSLANVAIPALRARWASPHRTWISDWDDLFADGGIYEKWNRPPTRWFYRSQRWFEHSLRVRADGVTATSHYLAEKARRLRRDERVAYLPSGANVRDIPLWSKEEARRALGLESEDTLCTYLGGRAFGEDALTVLDALPLIVRQGWAVRILFVGFPDPRYRAVAARHGVSNHIHFLGCVPFADVPTVLGASDLLLMPLHECPNSHARGPIKLRDYFCAGRPIVGTAIGEVRYWLSRYPVGRLGEPGAEGFARAWLELLEMRGSWDTMGRMAREVAERELSWEVIGERIRRCMTEWAR